MLIKGANLHFSQDAGTTSYKANVRKFLDELTLVRFLQSIR